MRKSFVGLITLAVLSGLGSLGCSRHTPQQQQETSTTSLEQVKLQTGISLPQTSTLITFEPTSRNDVEMWLYKLNETNTAQYPGQMDKLFVGSNAVWQAQLLERIGHISIKQPTACYGGVWDWKGCQISTELFTTTADGSYVMIQRFYVSVQGNQGGAKTN